VLAPAPTSVLETVFRSAPVSLHVSSLVAARRCVRLGAHSHF